MTSLTQDIETIEAGYEFLLAYAAQGREDDDGQGGSARETLTGMAQALDGVAARLRTSSQRMAVQTAVDIDRAQAVIELVLSAPRLSSELIDNLNASIHLRTVLTDLFVVGEVARQRSGDA